MIIEPKFKCLSGTAQSRTFEGLRKDYEAYVRNGSKLKDAKHFNSEVNEPILCEDYPGQKVIEKVPPPGW